MHRNRQCKREKIEMWEMRHQVWKMSQWMGDRKDLMMEWRKSHFFLEFQCACLELLLEVDKFFMKQWTLMDFTMDHMDRWKKWASRTWWCPPNFVRKILTYHFGICLRLSNILMLRSSSRSSLIGICFVLQMDLVHTWADLKQYFCKLKPREC